jgi:hypothetical protein
VSAQGDAMREIAAALEADATRLGVLAGGRAAGRVMDLYALADEVDCAIDDLANRVLELEAELEEEAA